MTSKSSATPEAVKKNRSNAMIALGALLLLIAMLLGAYGTGDGPGVLIYGLFGVALIVGALVIRP
jgi:hypothetical protein